MNARKIATAALAALALGGGAAVVVAPVPASAASLPKIQTTWPGLTGNPPHEASGWHHGRWRVRPGSIYFGEGAGGAAPDLKSLHWTSYGQSGARAHGKWWLDNCVPNCAQGGHWVKASVRAHDVFDHRGPGRNFGKIRVTWHGGRFSDYINSKGAWGDYTWVGNH
jgi:hypothetical protein